MTFIKSHWLDVLAWTCIVAGTINMVCGIVTWDRSEMTTAALALVVGAVVLNR